MTVRVLHLWWHDPDPPDWVRESRVRWQRAHPHWGVILWAGEPETAIIRAQANELGVIAPDRVRHCSNVVRWHLLWALGGVWVDCDTEPLQPLDALLDEHPFCGSMLRPEPTVIGGPAGHRLWRELLRLSARQPVVPTTAPQLSGAHALTEALTRVDDVRVLEPSAFFDRDSNGAEITATGIRYCRHRWDTSAQRQVHGHG